MYSFIYNNLRKLRFRYKAMNLDEDSIKLFWYNRETNFGDYLNYDLVSNLTDKKVQWVPYNYNKEYYMAIGSILQVATDKTIVWGSGLIDDKQLPIKKPKEILAVRGPLTRKRLLDAKIKCPEIYGDPALLIPEYYFPNNEKEFDLGIIPHYVDKHNDFFLQKFNSNIKIIDIEQPNYKKFIDDVTSCKKIISSSLHGIIIADAYDIPALRIKFSNKIIGGDFKFNDYYLSVNRDIQKAIQINDKTTINDILKLNFNYNKKIDTKKLLDANPFK